LRNNNKHSSINKYAIYFIQRADIKSTIKRGGSNELPLFFKSLELINLDTFHNKNESPL